MTGLKNCKNCQKMHHIPQPKKNWVKKWMEVFKSIRGGYARFHIPHKSQKKPSFLRLPYLEYGFIVANVVRLNITVGKISEASQEYTSGGAPC